MRALLFAVEPEDFARAARTMRSLSAAGVTSSLAYDRVELIRELESTTEPVWMLRCGAWQPVPGWLREIPRSASGRPVVGLGGADARGVPSSVYLDASPARALGECLRKGKLWQRAVDRISRHRSFRSVPLHDVRVRFDTGLRVVQVVTTIQIGGAERVTLDLAEEANRTGTPTVVAALGLPTRRAFARPQFFADLSEVPFDPESRAAAVERLCLEWGADLVHAHLVRASEAAAIRARGIPLVLTMHNMAASWPPGYIGAPTAFADLFLGCAEAVTREATTRVPGTNAKTVWNGVDPRRGKIGEPAAGSDSVREKFGWDGSDFVLIAVANPRSQKRLERLPEIMARLEERIAPRRVRLIVVGEAASGSADGRDAMLRIEAEIDLWHVRKAIHWSSGMDEISPLLAAADVFVSTSAVEGLSLAQLEALAAGLPVVATNVGGAREVADRSDRMFLVSKDADAESFAKILARLADAPPPRTSALPKAFTRERMAARSNLLYRGLLVRANLRLQPRRQPVWLLTNNFSTGGAQSSARRLLTGLASRGHQVRAATIEEAQERPSPGRKALNAASIPVTAIPPNPNPEALVAALLDALAADPPRAVLFWNLITPVKVLLADAMPGIPIYDVSPGEMYFESLNRFFAAVPAGLPVETPRKYGKLLEGVIVKYSAEAARAEEVLGTRVHVIPNGVSRSERSRPGRNGKCLVIGTAARLSPDKRLDQLLEAVHHVHARLPKYELRIAGGPEAGNLSYGRQLRRLACRLPVVWCGKVDDIASFMSQLDIFAMISEPGGCPNVSLEAMSSSLPIVATDHGGASEQVISGVNGLLVPRGDTAALGEALLALANDSAMCERMGDAARMRADSVFGMQRMLDDYSTILGLTADRCESGLMGPISTRLGGANVD